VARAAPLRLGGGASTPSRVIRGARRGARRRRRMDRTASR
jgi:hypothetical protein